MVKKIINSKNIDKLTDVILKNPWKLIIFFIFSTILLMLQIPSLKSDYGIRTWFRTTDPLIKDINALEQKFGNDESVLVAMHAPDDQGIFTPERILILQELTKKFWTLPEVVRVDSLINFNYSAINGDDIHTEPFLEVKDLTQELLNQKRALALENKILAGQFISHNGKTAIVNGQLRPDINGSPDYKENIKALKKIMLDYEKTQGVSFHYIGASNINDAYREVSENDIKIMMPINILIMIVFLFFIFRTIESVLLPLCLVAITILSTTGLSAFLGLKFDNLSAAIPGILIATCMADCIHVFTTYYRLRGQDLAAEAALKQTMQKNFFPTFLTSITTAIGFFTLTTTELIPVRNMTFLAGLGVIYAWILTIFLIMPILSLLPYRPFKLKEKTSFSKEKMTHYVDFLDRNKRIIFYSCTLSIIVMTIIGSFNNINSDPLKHFAKKLKVYKDTVLLLNEFKGLGGPQIVVDSGGNEEIKNPAFLRKVENFIFEIEKKSHVNKVASILSIIKELNQKLNQNDPSFYRIPETHEKVAEILLLYSMGLPQGMDLNNQVTLDGRYLKLSMLWNIHDAQRSLREIDEIYIMAQKYQLDIKVTGKIVLYHRMIGYIVKTFMLSISLALVMIGITMAYSLGSWRLGLLSLLPNIMPLTFGAALMTLMGSPIDIGTSLVISVCLGIAVDDTIHFLFHYKEAIEKYKEIKPSLIDIFVYTAPSLIFTTIVLSLCFGVFIFANFVPNINFGILCSIILSIALVADLVYLPVILMMFKIKK